MLGLRYYVCEACDAVHADVGEPTACGRCGDGAFVDVSATVRGDDYFTRGLSRNS
ncbi:hypothetical protein [Halobaculum litoreum]|uniref:Rubrerythrin-like domain-containing protein n=1 Tax=Halobaculum litoreum TaxID=3031998 RepID=A0ABD5XRK5_9EURY|nr:hypothetical protein [Halobaculum sp. DT92]